MSAAGAVTPPMVWALLAATVLLAVLTIVLVIIAIGAGLYKPQAAAAAPADEAAKAGPVERITRVIARAVDELRLFVAGGRGPDDVPWVLVLGAGSDDLKPLLPATLKEARAAVRWLDPAVKGLVGDISFHQDGVVVAFSDGLLGDALWRPRLNGLLRALDLKKPGRPIDALVVVLPFDVLNGDLAALSERGARTYEAILAIQRRTGWRLPIHMVITGCDALPGFADWRRASASAGGEQMLGWSVPYALDSVFRPEWADEAIDSMVQSLALQAYYLLMRQRASDSIASSENIFLFSARLGEICPRLRTYLTATLRKSAYHEEFMLRDVSLVDGSGASQALFGKVFAERRLAQPAFGEMTRRHRQIRVAQWVLVGVAGLCALGLGGVAIFGQTRIPGVHDLLCGVRVETLGGAAGRMPGCERVDQSDTGANLDKRALALLDFMANIDTDGVVTPLAPTSLLTGANTEVTEAINRGYGLTVFRAISNAMTTPKGVEALLTRGADPRDPAAAWPKIVDNFKDYRKYYAVARSLRSPDINKAKIESFMDLVYYIFNVKLPATFAENYSLYGRGIARSQVPDIDSDATKQTILDFLRDRFAAATCVAYTKNPVVQAYENRPFPEACPAPAAVDYAPPGVDLTSDAPQPAVTLDDVEPYAPVNLLDRLGVIARELAIPGRYDWIYSASAPNPEVDKLGELNQGSLLAESYIDEWTHSGRDQEERARRTLSQANLGGVPLLDDDHDHAVLSKPMVNTRQTLQAFYAESFVQPGETAVAAAPFGTGRVAWDREKLLRAEEAAESFVTFVAPLNNSDDNPDDVPVRLRALIRESATHHLVAHLQALLRSAQRPLDPAASDVELASFEAALPILTNVRDTLTQAGALDAAKALDDRVRQRAAALLADLDGQLSREVRYQPADGMLPWSPPNGLLAEAAFRTDSHDDLKASLAEHRSRVAALAQRARPLAAYLTAPASRGAGGVPALAQRWRAIALDVDSAAAGDPNSPVLRLEQFVLDDMDKIAPPDCPQAALGGSTDYFAAQLQTLRASVIRRCNGLARQSMAERYTSLVSQFRADLAGRFPFGAAGSVAPSADPEAVRQFFKDHGPDIAALAAWLNTERPNDPAARPAALFLSRLAAVQTALAPMLSGPKDTPLAYRVNVTFFTDSGLSVAQNQIIETSIGAGDAPNASRASSLSPAPWSFDWTNGEPVNITLRWAVNAASMPSAARAGRWPSVDGFNARFRIDDTWALLRLISRAGGAATALGAGRGAIVLETPLQANARAATGRDAAPATGRAFLRLALVTPPGAPGQDQKATPVSLPVFPDTAPDLPPPVRGAAVATR